MLTDAPKRSRIAQDAARTHILKSHPARNERSLLFAIARQFLRTRLTTRPRSPRDDAQVLEDTTHHRKLRRRPEESLQSVRLATSGVVARLRGERIQYRDLATLSALRQIQPTASSLPPRPSAVKASNHIGHTMWRAWRRLGSTHTAPTGTMSHD